MKIGAAVGDFISVTIKTQNFHAYREYYGEIPCGNEKLSVKFYPPYVLKYNAVICENLRQSMRDFNIGIRELWYYQSV